MAGVLTWRSLLLYIAVGPMRDLMVSVHAMDLEVRSELASHGASGTRMNMQFINCAMEAACRSMQARTDEQQPATDVPAPRASSCSILTKPNYISPKTWWYRAVRVQLFGGMGPSNAQTSTKVFSFGSTNCPHGVRDAIRPFGALDFS